MEKKILDKLDSFDFSLQQKRMLVEVIKDIIISTKSDTPVAQSDPLRPLFEAAGATYVPETETYTVNGIDGITKDEVCKMYFCATNNDQSFTATATPEEFEIKTNFLKNGLIDGTLNAYSKTFMNSNVKVLKGAHKSISFTTINPMTFYNSKIETILTTLQFDSITINSSSALPLFKGCKNLINVKIHGLKHNLYLADSPLLSATSIKEIVEYRTGTNTIYITVHDNVFDKIEQNEEEWAGIKDAATEKNITFAVQTT